MSTTVLSLTSNMPMLKRPLLRTSMPAAAPARRVTSVALLDGAREVVIQHQGGEYHLRLTRNDKLILTK